MNEIVRVQSRGRQENKMRETEKLEKREKRIVEIQRGNKPDLKIRQNNDRSRDRK